MELSRCFVSDEISGCSSNRGIAAARDNADRDDIRWVVVDIEPGRMRR